MVSKKPKTGNSSMFNQEWEDFRKISEKAMIKNRKREEELWNSFSPEQQLDIFCAVMRRVYQAEIVDKGSYRYALYTIFGFDLDSYGRAMDAGYLDIHNAFVE